MSEEKSKEKSLIDQVLNIDSRWIFLLLSIVLIIPLVRPIGFPIAISSYTRDFYNYISGLEPGSLVLIWSTMGWGWWPSEYRPATIAFVQYLIDNDIKFITICGHPDDPLIWDHIVHDLIDLKDYEYGVDYLILGYYPGEEAAKAAFASNVRSIVKTDYLEAVSYTHLTLPTN